MVNVQSQLCFRTFSFTFFVHLTTPVFSDVQLILAKQWGIVIPGLGPPVPKKPKLVTAATLGATSTTTTTSKLSSSGGGGTKRRASGGSASGQPPSKKSNTSGDTGGAGL